MTTLARQFARFKSRVPPLVVEQLGLPPAWVGYRSVRRETVREHLARLGTPPDRSPDFRVVHPSAVVEAPLPRNVPTRETLPDLVSWWTFSFQDVPNRRTPETFVATLPDCRVLYRFSRENRNRENQFRPAILTRDDRSLELREMRFRDEHITLLRRADRLTTRLPAAVWFLEREYTNYAHWVTAHLPKLIYLQREGRLDQAIFPRKTNRAIDESLAALGIRIDDHRRLDEEGILAVDRLTVIGSDRFRPEMLGAVRDTLAPPGRTTPTRRLYISRSKAPRRRVLNDDAVWMVLEAHGFERVWMEDLGFDEQVRAMASASIVVAPHGAGLANITFCAPGTQVVELVLDAYPAPNFYAIASGLQLPYWMVNAREIGEGQPSKRDVEIDIDELRRAVAGAVAAAGER